MLLVTAATVVASLAFGVVGAYAAPPNESATTAPSVNVGSQFTGSNVGGTTSDHEVWWKFVVGAAEQGHELTVSLCGSDFDTGLEVRNGVNGVTVVASNVDGFTSTCPSNDLASSVTFVPSSQGTYYIKVFSGSVVPGDTGAVTGRVYVGPDTGISAGPTDGQTVSSSSVSFTLFSTSISASTFECSLDSAPFTACSSSPTYSLLPNGDHTFAARSTAGGATDADPILMHLTVDGPTADLAPPTLT